MRPVQGSWNADARVYRGRPRIGAGGAIEYLHRVEVGKGLNHRKEDGKWHPNSLTPVPSDDPAYDWMWDDLPHKTYLSANGSRRVFPDRNNPSRFLDLDVPPFMAGKGSLEGNLFTWEGPGVRIEIMVNTGKVSFDAIFASDPGITSFDIPVKRTGMSSQEVLDLFASLVAYPEDDPADVRAISAQFVQGGNKVRVSWDFAGWEAKYPIRVDPTVTLEPTTPTDDVTHRDNHTLLTGGIENQYIIAGVSSPTTYGATTRYSSVPLPSGAKVQQAYFTFYAKSTRTDVPVETILHFEEADNGSTVTNDTEWHTAEAGIGAGVPWTISETWNTPNPYQSPDVSTILQTVVDRPGWAYGNSLRMFWLDNGSITPNFREAAAWEDSTRPPVQLTIDYWGAVRETVAADGDDFWYRRDSGLFVSLTSGTLPMGRGPVTQLYDSGFRFSSLSVPKGAVIQSAKLIFKANDDFGAISGTACNLVIYAVDDDDPAAPGNAGQYLALPLTAGVAWDNVEPWIDFQFHESVDIAALVQAIVDRPGYETDKAFIVVVQNNGSDAGALRTADSFYGGHPDPVRLEVSWTRAVDLRVLDTLDDVRHIPFHQLITTNDRAGAGADGFGRPFDSAFRYPGFPLPNGVSLTSAYLSGVAYSTSVGDGAGWFSNWRAHDADDSPRITSDAEWHAIADAGLTDAVVPWDNEPTWVEPQPVVSPSLVPVIQEVINRPGWVAGNDFQLFILNDGSSPTTWRFFHSSDSLTTAYHPVLHLEWIEARIGVGAGTLPSLVGAGVGLRVLEISPFSGEAGVASALDAQAGAVGALGAGAGVLSSLTAQAGVQNGE